MLIRVAMHKHGVIPLLSMTHDETSIGKKTYVILMKRTICVQGHCYRSRTGKLERYFKPDWLMSDQIPTQPADLPAIKVHMNLS